MLNISTLIEFVKELEGIIPEKYRIEVAYRLSNLIAEVLRIGDKEKYRVWMYQDRLKFLRLCELKNTEQWAPNTLRVEPNVLADFCNKWMSINLFKTKNETNADWRPITPDMNSLRVTMIEELKSLDIGEK
jgi:hypothetical protein